MSTRDEAIRTAPEGRLWVSDRPGSVIYVTRDGVEVDYWANGWQGTHAGKAWTDHQFEESPTFTEVERPATLPPASGDLPDGTRVRVTYEGVTEGWANGCGQYTTDDGTRMVYDAVILGDIPTTTVEVLALPEPTRPDPLAGEPGSQWVDPETDTHWVRRVVENSISEFTQIAGDLTHGGALVSSYAPDSPVIGRLVPVEVSG